MLRRPDFKDTEATLAAIYKKLLDIESMLHNKPKKFSVGEAKRDLGVEIKKLQK